jgi:drug/metabolite transporter (DMT)-like permease
MVCDFKTISSPAKAFAFALIAAISTVGMDASAKFLTGQYPVEQIGFFRATVALAPFFLLILLRSGKRGFTTRHPQLQLLRGAVMVGGTLFFFAGLSFLPLSEATALFFVEPLFVIAFSMLILRERTDKRLLVAAALGFAGAMIMLKPTHDALQMAALFPLVAAAFSAVWMILGRITAANDSSETSSFYTTLVAALICASLAIFNWTAIKSADAPAFLLMGLTGGLSTYCYTRACQYASASSIAPIDYSAILWAALVGYVAWSDKPDLAFVIGSALIIGSGLYALSRQFEEKKLAEART